MNPLLELNNVSYAYHSKSGETAALSDLSFQVYPGEFIAVVGPSGCGKSTLLSLISGLLIPEKGSILFDGQTDKSRIGYMLQKDHLFEWRTIYRNITLGLEMRRHRPGSMHLHSRKNSRNTHRLSGSLPPSSRTEKEALGRVEQMLKDYGLEAFRDARPGELSGGMRQRTALIRTLAPNPELLLLDEPFSALDYQTRLAVCDDVAAILCREKKTALLVTHDLSEAISMADRIIVLTKRPARIRAILDISFSQESQAQKALSDAEQFLPEGTVSWQNTVCRLTPFERRSEPEFSGYFNLLWKELNTDE